MAKYKYNAVGKQGKNLTGIIEADNEDNARKKLNKLQLSVISISKTGDEQEAEHTFNKFKFEANDKDGKLVIGTISSKDLLNAFERLITEYNLKVVKLSGITTTQEEFDKSVNLVTKLYSELETLKQNKKADKSGELIEQNKKQKKFYKTIEDTILILSSLLNNFSQDLKPEAKDFFVKYLDHLQKIKNSENFDNLLAAATKALSEIERAQIFINEQKDKEEKLKLRIEAMDLKSLLKQQNTNIKSNPFSKFFNKLNLNKEIKVTGSKNFNYIKLFIINKSGELKKHLLLKLASGIRNIFRKPQSSDKKSNVLTPRKNSELEIKVFYVTIGLLAGYLIYYFLGTFISEKILIKEVNPIFYIYNTSILIYIIIGVIFLHSAIRLRSLLDEHKIKHSKITYTLFSILYLLIIINF